MSNGDTRCDVKGASSDPQSAPGCFQTHGDCGTRTLSSMMSLCVKSV